MKVAMWTSWQTRCGIAAYSAALVRELEALGHQVEIVPVPYTERDPAAAEDRVRRSNAADLVHIQHEYTFFGGIAPGASSLPAYLSRLTVPRVVTGHTVFTARELLRVDQETRPRQRLAKRLLSALPLYRASVERAPFAGAAAVIVHTEAARQRLQRWRIPEERLHVQPAGIPLPAAAGGSPEEVAAFRTRHQIPEGRVVALFGYVTADKGYELVLEAMTRLPPGFSFLIAGGSRTEHEQPYMAALQAEIRRRNLEARVRISGFLEEAEIRSAMTLADLVVVPHLAANGSYSVMFALGHGRPVLAADLPCFREIAENHQCAELFPAGDAEQLGAALGRLLASYGTRTRLAEHARAFAAERSWKVVAERTAAIYTAARERRGA
jgi:glycosyltransferase involved in cell wall biosynthesis